MDVLILIGVDVWLEMRLIGLRTKVLVLIFLIAIIFDEHDFGLVGL